MLFIYKFTIKKYGIDKIVCNNISNRDNVTRNRYAIEIYNIVYIYQVRESEKRFPLPVTLSLWTQ